MNDVDELVMVDQEYHLAVSTAGKSALYYPRPFLVSTRVWRSGVSDNMLRFPHLDAVLGNVLDVPAVPAEFTLREWVHRLIKYTLK